MATGFFCEVGTGVITGGFAGVGKDGKSWDEEIPGARAGTVGFFCIILLDGGWGGVPFAASCTKLSTLEAAPAKRVAYENSMERHGLASYNQNLYEVNSERNEGTDPRARKWPESSMLLGIIDCSTLDDW